MFDLELEWTLELEVVTPMRIGSGEDYEAGEGEARHRVGAIQRDHAGRAHIPGSTLKGALRALDPEADDLWGVIKANGSGRMGRATIYGASAEGPEISAEPLPRNMQASGPNAFVAAHVQIDPATGAADEHLLFFKEMTPPGVRFKPRLTLRFGKATLDDADNAVVNRVRRILGRLEAEGLRLGSGSADADGRLRLAGSHLTARAWAAGSHLTARAGARGKWVNSQIDGSPVKYSVPGDGSPISLVLTCEGPFLILDGEKRANVEPGQPHLKALRLPDGRAWTPGSSLTGAMRARLAWLASLDALRGGEDPAAARAEGLKAAKAVFGSTDQRAPLRLTDIRTHAIGKPTASPRTQTFTSVSLDRFSAAPLDGALFTSEAFVGVMVAADLVLDSDDQEIGAWVARLLNDLGENGLQIGSAGARGFGWFAAQIHQPGDLDD